MILTIKAIIMIIIITIIMITMTIKCRDRYKTPTTTNTELLVAARACSEKISYIFSKKNFKFLGNGMFLQFS